MELLTWVIGAAAIFAAPLGIVTAVHFVVRTRRRSAQVRLKASLAASAAATGAARHEGIPPARVTAAGCAGGVSLDPFKGIEPAGRQEELLAGRYALGIQEMEPANLRHGEWGGADTVRGTAA